MLVRYQAAPRPEVFILSKTQTLRNNYYKTGEVQWFNAINPQLNVYYLGNGDIEGDVWRFESPDWNQMDYSMDFDSTRLMFDLGINIVTIEKFSLYAIGGAGLSWNNTQLNATPNQTGIDCGVAPYDLAEHSSTSLPMNLVLVSLLMQQIERHYL